MRGRLTTRALLGIVSTAVALTPSLAATASPSTDSADPHRTSTQPYEDYVALGDSYTAGPLIPVIRLDPLGCVRSTSNYPAFLAGYLQVTTYTDVSCSGAETKHMREPQPTFAGTNPPQLGALGTDTDLVTLGIGGNDFGLFGEMTATCPSVREQDPTGSPCRDAFTVDGVDTKMRDARRVEGRVSAVVRAIQERSPSATVVVVGYPRILPQHGTCPAVVPFADGDYRWADRIERRLNTSVRAAARRNGATYVDMYPASRGHDACAGVDAWINGDELKPLRALPYHPFRSGMAGVAATVYRKLSGEPAPHHTPSRTDAPWMSRSQQGSLAGELRR